MKKIYIIFLTLIMIIPIRISAYYDVDDVRCTSDIKSNLKNLANNIEYRLTKNTIDNSTTYDLIFYNVSEKLYLSVNNVTYKDRINGLIPGSTISIIVYASDQTYCYGYKVLTKNISIPYYNPYFMDSICEGYDDYYLCSENANVKMSYDDFILNMQKYIKSLEVEVEELPEIIVEEPTIWEIIGRYSLYIYTGLVLIFVIVGVILIKKIKNRKERIL